MEIDISDDRIFTKSVSQMSERYIPSASIDSHTIPMEVKLPLIDPPLTSDEIHDESIHSVNRQVASSSTIPKKSTSNQQLASVSVNRQVLPSRIDKYFNAPQIQTKSFYQALLSEYIGTFILVLIATSTGLPINSKPVPDLNGALVSGFVVATIIVGFGHVSGAHVNPAVTVTFLAVGEIDFLRGLCYIGIQLLGAISASHLVDFLAPPAARGNLGMTVITDGVTLTHAFIVEMIITFILCHTVHAICDRKREDIGGSKALVVGLAVTVNCLFAGSYTGAAMNPARSFGPASVMNTWTNHWIYWAGPITGSLLSALLYNCVLKKTE